jgi:hypothetical protein
MKTLLFHAVPAQSHQSQLDWENFLREAALLQLPTGSEQLAPNVWMLPDDGTDRHLALIGHRNAIATRVLAVVHSSNWQALSPPP